MKFTVKEMVQISFFTALAVLAAFMLRFGGESIVPFSIMPLVVMLAGTLLGARNGAFSMFIYMFLGLISVPVFQSPPFGGLAYVFKPTFGFVIGYIGAAYVIGLIAHKGKRSVVRFFMASVAGLVVLYAIGLPYFLVVIKFYLNKNMTVAKALTLAFLPFILFDIIKAGIASMVAFEVMKRVEPLQK